VKPCRGVILNKSQYRKERLTKAEKRKIGAEIARGKKKKNKETTHKKKKTDKRKQTKERKSEEEGRSGGGVEGRGAGREKWLWG